MSIFGKSKRRPSAREAYRDACDRCAKASRNTGRFYDPPPLGAFESAFAPRKPAKKK